MATTPTSILRRPRRPRLTGPEGHATLRAAVASLLLAALVGAIVHKLGVKSLVIPAGLVVAALALGAPGWVAFAAFALPVMVEQGDGGLIPIGHFLYTQLAHHTLSPFELVVLVLAISVPLTAYARGRPLAPPRPFVAPLALLALALLAGTIVGRSNGAPVKAIILDLHPFVLLLLLPLLVANVLDDTSKLQRAVTVLWALASLKALLGLLSLPLHHAASALGTGTPLTYYEPAGNFVMLLALATLVAALMRRVPTPVWARAGGLLCLAALVLSYRRSFWIAAVLALAIVVTLAAGPVARRLAVPLAVLVVAAGWVAISGGLVTESQSPVIQRATSLSPTAVSANAEDRYRLDERRNVLAEVRAHPISGLGVEVPWAQRYPLSVQQVNGQYYVHMTLLWYWLKLGILGPIAYLWLSVAAILTGWRVWRRHHDDLVRAAGLAIAGSLVGLMVAELTASFTGVDIRLTAVVAVLFGFLAAARRDAIQGARAASGAA